MHPCSVLVAVAIASVLLESPSRAQSPPDALDASLAKQLHWRMVGPERGGRSAAVAGHADQPLTYWFGACGGGVWKTTDGGQRWRCVSDGFFGGSIGSIAVAPSDPNVVYVGGGEVTVRGNWSAGHGAWRSTDAGRSWSSIGFEDAQCIPRIRVHPRDADLVYAAVLGHLCGPSETRGVYRSRNGGRNWERVLQVDEDVGACDLVLDASNPRVLFASTWRVRRTPWSLESGGPGSGLWRSGDGGDTWSEITRKPGLPTGTVGIVGVAVSPASSDRVYAIVEAEEGGVFRSDDGGEKWQRVNEDRSLRQRAWYYTRIYADPKNADVVYVVNVQLWRSGDGGKTFESIRVPHVDNHDLWIAPNDPDRLIGANDGGACVSFDGGANWSTIDNQPTAQFYRVTIDHHEPWRIYGAQQDNSTVRLYPFGMTFSRGGPNWEESAGGESGWLAPDPRDPEIVFGGSYGGFLQRVDHRTGESRNVSAWPDNPIGWGAADLRYRFQWNFPLLFSRHDPQALYAGANVLFVSRDEGQSWAPISSDLTRNDKSRMGPSGGPITKDNTGVEVYGTIFTIAESSHEPGVLWCGSDDGLVHVTRDGGRSWSNVTPKILPEWTQINSIEAHPFERGGLYLAATSYKSDDYRPWLLRTVDFGRTWTLITHGIDERHFTRVIRADPVRRGWLFAGTEAGIYTSFDDGDHWRSLQLDLPIVPITDLAIRDETLVAATQGRSFWILDELALLRQTEANAPLADLHLFAPAPLRPTHRRASIDFFLKEAPKEDAPVALRILDSKGLVVRTFARPAGDGDAALEVAAGFNRATWDGAWPDAKGFDGLILWGGGLAGPRALPGTYTVELVLGAGESAVQRRAPLEVLADPRSSASSQELESRFDFLLDCRDLLTRTHETIAKIRDLRGQLGALRKRLDAREDCAGLVKQGEEIVTKLTAIEEALYQTKLKSGQDPLNYPIRLNNKLAALAAAVAGNPRAPTAQAMAFRAEIGAAIEVELARFRAVLGDDLPAFNQSAMELRVPALFLSEERAATSPAASAGLITE